jgi:hypothetical protein
MSDIIKCPKCKEDILSDAEICKHCKFDLIKYRKDSLKREKQALLKAKRKSAWKNTMPLMIKANILLAVPFVIYLIVALIILPVIRNKENNDRILGSAYVTLLIWDGFAFSVDTKSISDDPVFKFCVEYVDNKHFSSIDDIYTHIRYCNGFKVYNKYKSLLPSKDQEFIDSMVEFDRFNASDFILKENVSIELDKARSNWNYGYKDQAYKRIGSAIGVLNFNRKAYIDSLDHLFDFRRKINMFADSYGEKYKSKLVNIIDDSTTSTTPNWMSILFPNTFLCLNYKSVDNFPDPSFTIPILNAIEYLLVLSVMLWGVSYFVVIVSNKK